MERYGSATFLKLETAKLATPSYTLETPPRVRSNGAHLASALAFVALNRPEEFRAIVAAVQSIIPSVRGVRFDRVQVTRRKVGVGEFSEQASVKGGTRRVAADAILIDFAGCEGVQADAASEGVLLALGLVTAIHGPGRPRTLLMDDIDRALHPKAQMELVNALRKILDRYPDLQIIATSHSPYILDRLEWNEVRVTSLLDDSSATCHPLTDHPDVERWKEAMSPGEFWSHLGDEWVKKLTRKEPAPAVP